MLRHKAQQKSVRQSKTRHERNVMQKSTVKTFIKKAVVTLKAKEGPDNVKAAIKVLDKLEIHGVAHKNTVARKKSRLMIKLNKAQAQV